MGGGSRSGVGMKNRSIGGSETKRFTAVCAARFPRLSSRRFGGVPAGAGDAETSTTKATATSAARAARRRAAETEGLRGTMSYLLVMG
jgi:hypothetical protein